MGTTKKTEKKEETKKDEAKKTSGKKTYKVLQALVHDYQPYYPERDMGEKVVPADVIELTDSEAKAIGDDFVEPVK